MAEWLRNRQQSSVSWYLDLKLLLDYYESAHRYHHTAPISMVYALREALRRGGSLILFPEGTRGAGRLPGAFKPGLYRLAREFPDAELIPVYLETPSRALPKGELIPVPIACSVHFGAPVRPAEGERAEAFLERARGAVAEMAVP